MTNLRKKISYFVCGGKKFRLEIKSKINIGIPTPRIFEISTFCKRI
jgi:hypothetical protein